MLTGDHSVTYTGNVDWIAPMPMPATSFAPAQSLQSRTKDSRRRDCISRQRQARVQSHREAYTKQNDPEYVKRHLATESVRDGIQEQHANHLTQRLHGTPKCRVIGVQFIFPLGVQEANMPYEAQVGDDVPLLRQISVGVVVSNSLTVQRVLISICGGCNAEQIAQEHSLWVMSKMESRYNALISLVPS